MRDINTSGDHNGDIHVTEGRDYVPYNEASDEILAAEDSRLRSSLKEVRGGRYRRLGVGYVFGLVAAVGGLWWLNTLDSSLVGVIGVAAGVLTLYLTYQMWGQPKIDERNMVDGIETIRQVRQYRRTAAKPRRRSR